MLDGILTINGVDFPVQETLALIKSRCAWNDECFEYENLDTMGYGKLGYGSKQFKVHRLVYQLETFEILTEKQVICHKCDNRACCRFTHLFLGTYKTNGVDKQIKDRARKHRINYGWYIITELEQGKSLDYIAQSLGWSISKLERYQQQNNIYIGENLNPKDKTYPTFKTRQPKIDYLSEIKTHLNNNLSFVEIANNLNWTIRKLKKYLLDNNLIDKHTFHIDN